MFGGWVPVLSEEGVLPAQETEWKCSNALARLNLGTLSVFLCLVGCLLDFLSLPILEPISIFLALFL